MSIDSGDGPPILARKDHAAPLAVTPENRLREARKDALNLIALTARRLHARLSP